jgi:hypothetical protein
MPMFRILCLFFVAYAFFFGTLDGRCATIFVDVVVESHVHDMHTSLLLSASIYFVLI